MSSMWKYSGVFLVLFLALFPLFASAASCPNLTRNLSYGSRGNDVVELQNFLITQGSLAAGNNTGYFGKLTQAAVQKWQKKNSIVASGTPATTGYGVVGPRTRVAIARVCSINSPPPPTITPNPTPPPPLTGQSCTPLASQTQTLSCPTGQTGSITQTRTSACPGPTWSVWTTSTTCSATQQPPPSPPPATLAQYWAGQAEWRFERKYSADTMIPAGWPAGYGDGSQIVVGPQGNWYLFHRHVYNGGDTAAIAPFWGSGDTLAERMLCGFGSSIIGTDVRRSIDHGATWSNARPVNWPAKGSPWECMGGDGGAYYDATSNKWFYLEQSLALNAARTAQAPWGAALFTFDGADPLDSRIEWTPAVPASITSGSLWTRLCANPNSACAIMHKNFGSLLDATAHDEGTFDIFDKKFVDGQWWFYVTMHGFDGVLGYRGLFKTTDFVNWKVGTEGSDLPPTEIGSLYTTDGWNETWQGWTDGAGNTRLNQPWSIGVGAARILKEGDYYYMILEAADKNLAVVTGQHVDVGMLRTNNLANATWEQYASNPIFRSTQIGPQPTMIAVGYSNIFRDTDGTVYLSQDSLNSTDNTKHGIYLYRLVTK